MEEVSTGLWKNLPAVTGLLHARMPIVPVLSWSAEGFAAANLVIVALLLGFRSFVFQDLPWAVRIARVVAVIAVFNGLIHIIPTIVIGGYWSGSVSAFFLLGISLFLLIKTGRSHEYKLAQDEKDTKYTPFVLRCRPWTAGWNYHPAADHHRTQKWVAAHDPFAVRTHRRYILPGGGTRQTGGLGAQHRSEP
jgi:hypothetical protein